MSPLDQANPTSEWKEVEEEKSKSNRLKLILFGSLFIVLIISSILYYFYVYRQDNKRSDATIDGTENWETFENKTYGYSIKYDKTWQLSDTDDADVKFSFKTSGDPTLSTEKQYLEILSSNTTENYDSKLKETYLIGGKEGRIKTENGKTVVTLISDATKYILIQNDLDEAVFLKSVKTFKLITKVPEDTSKNATSNSNTNSSVLSQTFTNDSYFYSVKYPSDWLDLDMNGAKGVNILDQKGFKPIPAESSVFTIQVTDRNLSEAVDFYKSNLDGTITTETGNTIISQKGDIETTANFKTNDNKVFVIFGENKNPKFTLYYSEMYQSLKLLN